LEGVSVRVKWALASSLFIFVVFTIFATITYRSSVDLIVSKEQEKMKRAVQEAQKKLSKVNRSLTYKIVTDSLELDGLAKKKIVSKRDKNHGAMIEMNNFIYSLAQPSIVFNVYGVDNFLLYTTKEDSVLKWTKVNKEPEVVNVGGRKGLLVTQAVVSRKTKKIVGYIQVFDELSDYYNIRTNLFLTLTILEIISLALSAILGYGLSKYLLKPLQTLRDTMEVISKDPQTDMVMKDLNSNDEFEDLANIFNKMLDRIRSYIKQQEQFVSDVSHELRTPVAIIQGQLNMLERWGKDDPEVLDDAIKSSLQEINRMKDLVQEMLELTRAGQLDVHYLDEVTEVVKLTEQIVNNMQMLNLNFKINFTSNISAETKVAIYRNHLEQVMIILLDNAIKYSADKRQVDVEVAAVEKEINISVTDYGEGIAKDELDKIFNRFYRVDKARARKKGGNGLGLSIAYQLMDNYSGRISVVSEPNRGTKFTLHIPLAANEGLESE